MVKIVCDLVLILLSLVEVHCQLTAPYISFMDQTLADHSYVDISQVGTGSVSVQCHTDLQTCCSGAQGIHRGDWYFPNGVRLPFPGSGDIVSTRLAQKVDMRRVNNANEPTGIYRCDIETNAVHDNGMRETVYMGLYTSSGGDITIIGDEVIFDSDQLTVTCISTGGPATTVTWTRDSINITEGTETVLDDPETAQYTHTLTVTTGGEYTCTVENNKPSSDSATIILGETSPPSDVTAVQDGPTSVTVTWTASSDATGYRIHYTSDSDSGSETVSDGSTETHTLTGLVNGETYTISMIATSSSSISLPSESVTADMTVGLVPGQPTLSEMPTATATTISLSWSVPSGSVVTEYLVQWVRDTAVGCMDEDQDSTTVTDGSAVSYEIAGLQENSMYSMTVTASNAAGSAPVSNTVTAMTGEAAPSAPPSSVMVTGITSTTITVQWRPVPCIHQNGAITGYSVRYGVMGSSMNMTQTVDGASTFESTIENLMSSATYLVEVAAVNSDGTGVYSDPPISQLTRVESPVVTVGESTATSIAVSWSSGGSEGVSYEVQWTYTGQCTGVTGDSASVGGSRSHTIMGLEEFSDYSITVRASNFLSEIDSDPVTGTTSETVPSAPPSEVKADGMSITISVWWEMVPCTDQNGAITSYSVRYEETESGSTQTVSTTERQLVISGVSTSTNYSVEVAAVNSAGTGVYSSPIFVTTDNAISVTVVSAMTTSIVISWTLITGVVAEEYTISYSNTENTECFTISQTVSITDGSEGSYNIEGLEEGTEYSIAVSLIRGGGVTDMDTVKHFTTDAAPSAPPSSVMVTDVTSTIITVQWGPVEPCADKNGAITGYSVRYGVMGSSERSVEMVSGDSSGGEATVSGLAAATEYEYEVAAITSAGTGVYSAVLTTLTSVAPPNVMLDTVGPFSATISWDGSGPVVDSYEVNWQRNTSGECGDEHQDSSTISGSDSSYDFTNLFGNSLYSVTVTASNSAGTATGTALFISTSEAAPSAPPASLTSSNVAPRSFTIQWGMVPCIHQNGDITGYSVLHGVQESESNEAVMISGSDNQTTTVNELEPGTTYLLQVAGVNAQGVGDYRNVTLSTPQTVYLTFGGMNLPSNDYVTINQLGSDTDTGLVCRTDQSGNGSGSWFNPSGTVVDSSSSEGFYVSSGDDGLYLLRGSGIPVKGIYTCRATDSSGNNRTVSVGIYNEIGGEVAIREEIVFTLTSELTAVNPQFTLTCISTGGPATTVTWTRDSTTVTEGTETVLDDPETAQYTHTLTLSGRLGGVYRCTVSNSISSTISSAQIIRVASSPTELKVVQEDSTSVRLTWTPPSPMGDTTGYTVLYSTGNTTDSREISGGRVSEAELTGLEDDGDYSISLVGRSQHLPSQAITEKLELVPALEQVNVVVTAITATSISLSWSVVGGSVTRQEVVWRETDSGTESSSGSLTGTSYTIDQLESTTIYTVTVRASNAAGIMTDSQPIIASTVPTVSEILQSANIDTCSCSESDDSAAAIGGVVVAVSVISALTVIAIVVLVLRSRRRSYSTNDRSDIADTAGAVLELSKFSGETYENPEDLQTSSNEAYNVVSQNRGRGGRGEGVDSEYEVPQILPSSKKPAARGGGGDRRDDEYEIPNLPPTTSSQPPTATGAAATAGESLYEQLR